MAQSDAQKAAKARYNKEKGGQISVRVSKAEAENIDKFINKHKDEITKTRFIVWACNYFIQRGELPPPSEVMPIDDIEDGNDSNTGNGE